MYWNSEEEPLLIRIEYGRPRLQVLHCSKVAEGSYVGRRYAQTLIDEKIWRKLWDLVHLEKDVESVGE